MPHKSGRMNPQESAFARNYAATGDAVYSATKAGYASPAPRASQNLAKPAVQAEIARVQTERLFSEALPLAVNALIANLTGATVPAGARNQAAKIVLQHTLATDDARRDKDPAEMTPGELAEAIERLKRMAAEKAKPVLDLQPIDDAGEHAEEGIFG